MIPASFRSRLRWPWLVAFWRVLRRATNPTLLSIHRLEVEKSDTLLQPFPATMLDRHPALFTFAQKAMRDVATPRILSFGCATGEEPISLAFYLPEAQIDAIDINPQSLAIARLEAERAGISSINYSQSDQPPQAAAIYDVVFCLSVLRHGRLDAEQPQSSEAIFPFAKYDTAIRQLDHCLKPGGLLIIWGSQYDFRDTAIAAGYVAQKVPLAFPHEGPVYGADNQLRHCKGLDQFVFKKTEMVAKEG